mmetsp:Transcript_28845/g.33523  ORF Transcript_28845/g.33523 Transcript_28845/m.33523 type:complete len:446 (+) Transcript_28845:204-1541(+)
MRRQYTRLSCEDDIKGVLHEMGIDIFEPEVKREIVLAEAMHAFSSFVLHEEPDLCQQILDSDTGGSVGELQGGSEHHIIYRVSIPDTSEGSVNSTDAAILLLKKFHLSRQGKRYSNVLTIQKLEHYMLGMCQRRARERGECNKFVRLGNFMFIFQFGGPTHGQVRHIDNMIPNVQICLYMSANCPSTIIYEMEGEEIKCGASLIEYWTNEDRHVQCAVPSLVQQILTERGNVSLKKKWYTKYFGFWGTMDSHLKCFGKLYQPVAYQHSLLIDSGTILIAGGNEVHAGPPTVGPRMFAFAIGIPEEGKHDHRHINIEEASINGDSNDGELQYSPVLLGLDFCTILFSIMDYEFAKEPPELVRESKHFLISLLMNLIQDYPMNDYLRQIDERRSSLLEWLEKVLTLVLNDGSAVELERLMNESIESREVFYTPDVVKRRSKQKQKSR